MNEDARMSKESVQWHFLHFIEDTRLNLAHLTDQLNETKTKAGRPHKVWVQAVTASLEEKLSEVEQFILRKGESKP